MLLLLQGACCAIGPVIIISRIICKCFCSYAGAPVQQQLGAWPSLGGMTLPTFSSELPIPAVDASSLLSGAQAGVTGTSGASAVQSGSSQLSILTRLPRRLCERIAALEFVEMNELLPETWSAVSPVDIGVFKLPSRRSPVTDIVVWTECFALMASVLVERYPSKAAHLFAYLKRIARAARNYRGPAWVAYDRMFRRQALARKSLDWGIEDQALCSEAFVGQAQAVVKCNHCLSELHTTESCPDLPRFMGVSVQPSILPNSKPSSSGRQQAEVHVCKKFNEGRCNHRPCKFLHLCMGCNKPHPVTRCPAAKQRDRSAKNKGRQ